MTFEQIRDAIAQRMSGHTIAPGWMGAWTTFIGLLRQVKPEECRLSSAALSPNAAPQVAGVLAAEARAPLAEAGHSGRRHDDTGPAASAPHSSIAASLPLEPTEEMRAALRARFHGVSNYAYEEAFWHDWKAVVASLTPHSATTAPSEDSFAHRFNVALARMLKVSPPTIRRWINGESAPHPLGQEAVLRALSPHSPT